MHLVITDSGLGGLSICAAIERILRRSPSGGAARLTYVNAWPQQGRGYNDLPDMASRARVFDGALRRMVELRPDAIVIACNTLSIVYEHTAFSRAPAVPVRGIVSAGVELFATALAAAPESGIVLLGTRTTIESGVHRDRLLQRGVAPRRVSATSCHGLAAAIEQGPHSAETREFIDRCAERVAAAAPEGSPIHAGLCCTHYGLVAGEMIRALERYLARPVIALDPNVSLVRDLTSHLTSASVPPATDHALPVEVISQVSLNDRQRLEVAALIEPVSPATASALRAYRQVPDLFEENA